MLSEEQRIDACKKRLTKAKVSLAELKRQMDSFDREFMTMCEYALQAGIMRPGETPGELERNDDERRESDNVRPVSQD